LRHDFSLFVRAAFPLEDSGPSADFLSGTFLPRREGQFSRNLPDPRNRQIGCNLRDPGRGTLTVALKSRTAGAYFARILITISTTTIKMANRIAALRKAPFVATGISKEYLFARGSEDLQ